MIYFLKQLFGRLRHRTPKIRSPMGTGIFGTLISHGEERR
jgi:hypothetical protein